MLLFTASAGRGEDGRAVILVRRRRRRKKEDDKESFLDGSEDIMDGLKEWVSARASPRVKPDGCRDYDKGKKHYCICVEKTTHAGSGSECSGRNRSFVLSFTHHT